MKRLLIIATFLLPSIGIAQVSLEAPMMISSYEVYIRNIDEDVIQAAESGLGYNLGLGLNISAAGLFAIKAGFHHWRSQLNTDYDAQNNNADSLVSIAEDGYLSFNGIYGRFYREGRLFFFGGGVDVSLNNKYTSQMEFAEIKEAIENDEIGSYLSDKFKNQFNLVFTTGFKLFPDRLISINPTFELVIPVFSIYEGVSNNTQVTEQGTLYIPETKLRYLPIYRFGIVAELHF